ncbi:IS110 family transposase [Arthrobacter humicola]|uniref:IS110 family transposase n=1 Tax=Arthrobacter humicola TaxID=409291 RepID=A0ABN2Z0C6_9MICC
MAIVAHTHQFVIGVDTHARTHTFAILVASTGEQTACEQFPATNAGMSRALAWAGRQTSGETEVLWAVEGIGTYGARLADAVAAAGYQVVEAPRMNARNRHGKGKSDPFDARAIALAALSVDLRSLRHPRENAGIRAALRFLVSARDQMTGERTATVNALTALVRAADLGIDARTALAAAQIGEISRWRPRDEDIALTIAREEAVRLAKRIIALDGELKANQVRLNELIQSSMAAPLLEKTGIGPLTAAVVITAWSHPGRVRSEAAFAALAGVNPIPASSGNTVRHRLNRGGDRRLNQALHMATIVRMTHDPDTRAYVERRLAEGRTKREIRRCLKRYLARHLYRALNTLHAQSATP